MIFLTFIGIVGFILFFSRFSYLRNIAPIFVISSIILILFLFASANLLGMGAKILEICGLSLFVFSACNTVLSVIRKTYVLYRPSIGSVLFIILGAIWFLLSRHMFIVGWDEFFWGIFTKAIKHSEAFYGPNDITSGYVRYTPGIPLFQYFFLTFTDFSENALFFSNGLIILSAFVVMIDLTAKKALNILLALVCCTFLLGTFYSLNYISIILDPVLGFLFGAGLSMAVFQKDNKNHRFIAIFPLLAILPIVKETGTILGVVVGMVFLLRVLFEYEWSKINLMRCLGDFTLCILFVALALLIPRFLWSHYLNVIGISVPYSVVDFSTIKQVVLPITEKNQFIAGKFYEALIQPLNAKGYPRVFHFITNIVSWIIVFSGIFILSVFFMKESKRSRIKLLSLFMTSIIGFIVYALFLLFCYQNFFTEYEGRALASFPRYMNTYILGVGFLSLTGLALARFKNRTTGYICLFFLILSILSLSFWSTMFDFNSSHGSIMRKDSVAVSKKINPYVAWVKEYVPSSNNVYLIYQNSSGMEKMVFSYRIWPRKVEFWNWSLGDKYGNTDVWTQDFSIDDFKEVLKAGDYKYLVLMHVDANFWRQYASMFSPSDVDSGYPIFIINFDSAGKLELKSVDVKF